MFTGIIETVGKIKSIESEGNNLHFEIESSISDQLKIDQSVSHQGVCLTVTGIDGNAHRVTAVEETLSRSTLRNLKPGSRVNLERSMPANGRFDGHIVQGHVDAMVGCRSVGESDGSWIFVFESDHLNESLLVEKGSVCIDGVSLTCFDIAQDSFSVAVIPYTFENTCFSQYQAGDQVNIEYDILGKFVSKMLSKN